MRLTTLNIRVFLYISILCREINVYVDNIYGTASVDTDYFFARWEMDHFFQQHSTPIIIAAGLIIATIIVQLNKRSRNRTFAINTLHLSSTFLQDFISCKGSADHWYSISEDAEINLPIDSDVSLLAQRGWRAIDTLETLLHDADFSKDPEALKHAEELLQTAIQCFEETERLYSLL